MARMMMMTKTRPILCLNTAGNALQVGLWAGDVARGDGDWLFRYQQPVDSQRTHSALLFPVLQQAQDQTGIVPATYGGVAVCVGPGSFTGLRAGVTFARALGQQLNVPVYPLDQLTLLATLGLANWPPGQPVTVALNARRGRVYAATYAQTPAGLLETLASPAVRAVGELPAEGDLWVESDLLTAVPAADSPEAVFGGWLPQAMARLLPDTPAVPWSAVFPLYLQLPNITVSAGSMPATHSVASV